MQVPHHGNNLMGEEFYKLVNPKVSFFSAPDWLMNNYGNISWFTVKENRKTLEAYQKTAKKYLENSIEHNQLDIEKAKKKKEKLEKGVYYNVPMRTKLTIYDAKKKFAELELPMGQFGTVEILSNQLFDKKMQTKATFFQSTGGVKDIME